MSEIKPCPFCEEQEVEELSTNINYYHCTACGAIMPKEDYNRVAGLEDEAAQLREALPAKALRPHGELDGWTIDLPQLDEIKHKAREMEAVSLEDTEAVILALIDLGYLPPLSSAALAREGGE